MVEMHIKLKYGIYGESKGQHKHIWESNHYHLFFYGASKCNLSCARSRGVISHPMVTILVSYA